MNDPTDQHDPPEPSDALGTDLKAIYARPVTVPADIDAAILESAAGTRPNRLRLTRWAMPAGAAAAAIAVGVMLWGPTRFGRDVMAGDLDGSGRVDIVDALTFAQRLPAYGVSLAHDMNGDGRLDQADIDAIAMRAVTLNPAGQRG